MERTQSSMKLAGSLLAGVLLGRVPAHALAQETQETPAVQVEDLRGRIRDMRMSMLLGGDKVREAEAEAVDFYGRRMEKIDERLDTVASDLAEKRATYEVTLDRALGASDPADRDAAMQKAQALSQEITSLEREAQGLEGKRRNVGKLVRAVEDRGRQREDLALRLETSSTIEDELGLSLGGVGLAPSVDVQPTGSPLDDDRLVQDLLARDPVAARRLLFEGDPAGYWKRFPLTPPADVLQRALAFPMPDLPGKR